MKKYILIFLILFLIGCSPNPKNGRYQLQWHEGYILILDTQTGTIWEKWLGSEKWKKYELKDLEEKKPSSLVVPNLFEEEK